MIGERSLLDSMKLVGDTLEDIADEHEFQFDWTSDPQCQSLETCSELFHLSGEFLTSLRSDFDYRNEASHYWEKLYVGDCLIR